MALFVTIEIALWLEVLFVEQFTNILILIVFLLRLARLLWLGTTALLFLGLLRLLGLLLLSLGGLLGSLFSLGSSLLFSKIYVLNIKLCNILFGGGGRSLLLGFNVFLNLGLDEFKRSTNKTSFWLLGLGLSELLDGFNGVLLVFTSVELAPADNTRISSLQEEQSSLLESEGENRSGGLGSDNGDVSHAVTGIDFVATESTGFSSNDGISKSIFKNKKTNNDAEKNTKQCVQKRKSYFNLLDHHVC